MRTIIIHDRPNAYAEESRPCFFTPCFFFRARRLSLGGSFSLIARERQARGTRPEVSGRVCPRSSQRASNTGERLSGGPRGPYTQSIYPVFCIADKVLATLGEGTFGKVVKVKDLQM